MQTYASLKINSIKHMYMSIYIRIGSIKHMKINICMICKLKTK